MPTSRLSNNSAGTRHSHAAMTMPTIGDATTSSISFSGSFSALRRANPKTAVKARNNTPGMPNRYTAQIIPGLSNISFHITALSKPPFFSLFGI